MKKIIIVFLILTLFMLAFAGCQNSNNKEENTQNTSQIAEKDTEAKSEKESETEANAPVGNPDDKRTVSTSPTTKNIVILSERIDMEAGQIELLWPGAGIEYKFNCTGGSIAFRLNTAKECTFRLYVDNVPISVNNSELFTIKGVRNIETPYIEAGEHLVRFVRVSDGSAGRAALYSTTFFGTLLDYEETQEDKLCVEFIGSTMASGFGLVENGVDATLAYPYLTAGLLNADYNITASLTASLLVNTPNFGTEYAASTDFVSKPSVIVVDLGAEDFAKDGSEGINAVAFASAYSDFLDLIRQKNGNSAKILCVYNALNDGYASSIIQTCTDKGGEKAGYYTLSLTRATGSTSTTEEQQSYATALKEKILSFKDAEIVISGITAQTNGDGIVVDYSTIKWN